MDPDWMSFCLDPELLSPPLSYFSSLPSEECTDRGFAALHQTPSSLHDDDELTKSHDQDAYPLLAVPQNSVLNTPASVLSPIKWHDLLQLFLERECSAPTALSANNDFDCHSPHPLSGPWLPSPGTCLVADGESEEDAEVYPTLQSSPVTAGTASEVATPELQHETSPESSPESKREETARGTTVCASSRPRHSTLKSNHDHKCIEKNYRDRLNSGFKNLTRALEACGDASSGSEGSNHSL